MTGNPTGMYQPRWLAYARAMGKPPESEDLIPWQFILWINEKWREFYLATKTSEIDKDRHVRFDQWLDRDTLMDEVYATEEYLGDK